MRDRRELSEAEYLATFFAPMRDATSSAEQLVDLWRYLDPLLSEIYSADRFAGWGWRVAFIKESGDARFQHIGVPVPRDNTYIVVVVDAPARSILGHHLLNLDEKYGLATCAT